MNRRDYLRLASVGLTASIAGCSGNRGDVSGTEDTDHQSSTGQEESTDARTGSSETTDPENQGTGTSWGMVGADASNTRSQSNADSPTQNVSAAWTFDAASSLGVPVVADDSVYICGGYTVEDETGNDPRVYSLNASDGSVQWSYETYPSGWPSPAVSGATLYVISADSPGIERDCSLRALDTADGSERWVYETGSYVSTAPIVSNGSVYVADWNTLYAFNAEDGSERWSHDFDNVEDASSLAPVVADGTVYVSYADTLHAVDAEEGTELWSYDEGVSRPVVMDGTALVYTDDTTLTAIETTDGTEIWSYDAGEPSGTITQTENESNAIDEVATYPAVADSAAYFGTGSGELVALDAADGSERWVSDLGSVMSAPALAGETLYVNTVDDDIYGIDTADGSEKTVIDVGERSSAPVVADDTVYVASEEATLAFRQN